MADQQAERPEQIDTADSVGGEPGPGARGRWATVLAVVAILAVAAGLAAGYLYWVQTGGTLGRLDAAVQRVAADQARLEAGLEAIRADFQSQRAGLEAGKAHLDEAQAQLQQRESEMREALNGVYQRLGRSTADWKAAEAEYLLLIANHRLRLARDRDTAVAALEAADERLRDTGDPGWIPIREAIASELAALRAVDLPDLPGLAGRIAGLIDQVGGLRLRGPAPAAPHPAGNAEAVPSKPVPASGAETAPPTPVAVSGAETSPAEEPHSMESLLRDGLKGLQSVLEIRRHDRPVVAMLAPEQQYFVFQNLKLQLQAARLGALQADPALYRSSLQTAESWLGELFDPEDPAPRAMQGALGQLLAIDVRPQLPDVSTSLKHLREHLQAAPAAGPEQP